MLLNFKTFVDWYVTYSLSTKNGCLLTYSLSLWLKI